ncbi:MAG: electron transfer flavoprotein subunit alpha/FixB family protein [Bacillota bacterium]|nr:electron transfer flavoprotein subunit alpha/FixB family protein [Bacillota bacterium]
MTDSALNQLQDLARREDYQGGIWVFVEQTGGQVHPVAFELLGRSQQLAADLQVRLTAVLIGRDISHQATDLIYAGADAVLLCDDAVLSGLPEDACTTLLSDLVQLHQPDIFLFGATAFGRSVAPRVAARVRTGLTADCTRLDIEPETGLLLQTRPAFGGNLMATIVTDRHRPQMATVRPGVLPALPTDRSRRGTIITARPPLATGRVVELARVLRQKEPGIADADLIVSAGRGIGSQKNLSLVRELAEMLGGVYGVSRPLVDMGWADSSHQIGQTGQAVAPRLLIACGISGAIQHLAGLGGAQTIVAINTDPEAPIFTIADYRIVGDCVAILQRLIREKIK